jgi:DNA-binding HxlR family transcriptional regulator
VLGRDYESQNCSAARALEVVGERWSLLIVRDIGLACVRRFNDLQRSLGVARNVLAARLDHLVAEGVLERVAADGRYAEYQLTPKGSELLEVIVALSQWGDRWYAPAGPPVTFHHAVCDGGLQHAVVCTACGSPVTGSSITTRAGPGRMSRRPRRAARRR